MANKKHLSKRQIWQCLILGSALITIMMTYQNCFLWNGGVYTGATENRAADEFANEGAAGRVPDQRFTLYKEDDPCLEVNGIFAPTREIQRFATDFVQVEKDCNDPLLSDVRTVSTAVESLLDPKYLIFEQEIYREEILSPLNFNEIPFVKFICEFSTASPLAGEPEAGQIVIQKTNEVFSAESSVQNTVNGLPQIDRLNFNQLIEVNGEPIVTAKTFSATDFELVLQVGAPNADGTISGSANLTIAGTAYTMPMTCIGQ